MDVFFPIEDGVVDAAAGLLVPYRCGLPFALDVDAGARRDETAQRLIVISSPGDMPIARDWPALSSST